MEKLLRFLRRLEKEGLKYTLGKSPDDQSIRVSVFLETEIRLIDFSDEMDIEIEVFQHMRFCQEEDGLETIFDRLRKSWEKAGKDLGIEFICPYEFSDRKGGSFSCTGLVKNFGAPKGVLIISRKDGDNLFDIGPNLGYYTPSLNPRYYECYDQEKFIETLREWGWYGPENKKPKWL